MPKEPLTVTGEGPILVVDDDRDIRELLAEMLRDRGFEVSTAANGREALSLLRASATRPALVLLDLMMPVMNGYDFVDALSREADLAPVPVVVISAGHIIDRQRFRPQDRVIAKPIDISHLLAVIDELRSGARGQP